MNQVGAFLKKWWPSILPGVTALWAVYGSQIQAFIAGHPKGTAVLAAAYSILAHLLASPLPQSKA